jgi:hypothetical protein
MEALLKKDPTCDGSKYDRYIFGTPYSPINGAVYVLKGVELPNGILLKLKEED